jgi:hypothetical protein
VKEKPAYDGVMLKQISDKRKHKQRVVGYIPREKLLSRRKRRSKEEAKREN